MTIVLLHSMWGLRAAEVSAARRAAVPAGVRPGTPVQLHYATGDRFVPADKVDEFRRTAEAAGASPLIRSYPDAGHYFTDESHPDHSPAASTSAWADLESMLKSLP